MNRDPIRWLGRFARRYGLYAAAFVAGVLVDRVAAMMPVIGLCP